jgi:hypothetical protein
MGIEGHESPRDVASEEKKHPWEIFPEDDSSEKNGNNKGEKKQKKNNKLILWLKTHVIVSVVAVVAVIAIVCTSVVVVTKVNEDNKKKEEYPAGIPRPNTSDIVYPEDFTVDKAVNVQQSFSYAMKTIDEVSMQGVDIKNIDFVKLEDNIDVYIDSLKTDYEKIYFELAKIFKIAGRGNTARAEVLLEEFNKKNYKLDKRLRFMYYRAAEAYYYMAGDKENDAKYLKLLREDPEFFEDAYNYLDEETGEVKKKKTKEEINKDWEAYKKDLEEGLYE